MRKPASLAYKRGWLLWNPEEGCIRVVVLPPNMQLIGPENTCAHTGTHTLTQMPRPRLSQKEELDE